MLRDAAYIYIQHVGYGSCSTCRTWFTMHQHPLNQASMGIGAAVLTAASSGGEPRCSETKIHFSEVSWDIRFSVSFTFIMCFFSESMEFFNLLEISM